MTDITQLAMDAAAYRDVCLLLHLHLLKPMGLAIYNPDPDTAGYSVRDLRKPGKFGNLYTGFSYADCLRWVLTEYRKPDEPKHHE